MANSISFVGRLTRDPEIKGNDKKLLSFGMANDVGFGDKKSTNFYNCTMWGERGVKLATMLKKGKEVFIIGELRIGSYKSKDGAEKSSIDINVHELIFVGPKDDAAPKADAPAPAAQNDFADEAPF